MILKIQKQYDGFATLGDIWTKTRTYSMKTRCLVIDDEPLAIEVIESYIQKIPKLEIVAKCTNPINAFEVLRKNQIDLIFLDIQMPQLNGIEFLKTLKNPPKVIFTTAYRDYALEGYELGAVDFLLKPFSFGRFMKAVNKIYTQPPNYVSSSTPKVKEIRPSKEPFIYVKSEKKMVKVYIKDILYVESLKDYVAIHTADKKMVTKQKISYMEEKLPQRQFLRVHRSYLIAVHQIAAFNHTQIDVGKTVVPIGRSYRQQVMDNLNRQYEQL